MVKIIALTVAASLAALSAAQTPGVTLVNDFWITPGGLPNQTSCAPLTVNTPATINFNVSSAPGTFSIIIISFCGCTPCAPAPAMGSSTCLPPPSTACPSSNQFIEALIFGGCPWIVVPGPTSNSAGFGTLPFPVPPVSPPITVGMQSVFLGPPTCVVTPFNVLMSPAWSVNLI
jgi:hypothetical protein